MRRVLLASVPFLALIVIGVSFFVLNKTRIDNQSVLGISNASAYSIKNSNNKKNARQIVVKPTSTLTSNLIIKPTKTPTPIPTKMPTPTPTNTPAGGPTPSEKNTENVSTPSDSVQGYIMQQINNYRSSQGLSSVSTDSNTCSFAKTRVQEVAAAGSLTHEGFRNRIDNHTLPYNSYHEVTENLAMTSDYKQVVTLWINSSGHAENMRKDTPFVCVESSGNYYVYEGWKP